MRVARTSAIVSRRTRSELWALGRHRRLGYEQLESRRLLSIGLGSEAEMSLGALGAGVDAGLSYWCDGRQISLVPIAEQKERSSLPGQVFLNPETGSRVGGTDEILVALTPGADPQQVFASAFSGYRRLRGTTDQYVVTLASGDAVATIQRANALRSQPAVAWDVPNVYHAFQGTAATND